MSIIDGLRGKECPENGNGLRRALDTFPQAQGYLKIYLPDGHLYRANGEPIGAGEEIWRNTGLPYGNLGCGERGYVLHIPQSQLEEAGYPVDSDLKEVLMAIMRPQQIPEAVRIEGFGVSGKDWIIEKLQMPLDTIRNGSRTEEELDAVFRAQLREYDISSRGSLRYRPSHLAMQFPAQYNILEYNQVRELANYLNGRDVRQQRSRGFEIASEFEYMTERIMESLGMRRITQDEKNRRRPRNNDYALTVTDGKTETFAAARLTDGIVDISETGNSLKRNGLIAIYPSILRSTPYAIYKDSTMEVFPEFMDRLLDRLSQGVEIVNREHPELFEDKLDPSVYGRAVPAE